MSEINLESACQFADLVPGDLFDRSGSVFYTGRAAFAEPSDLYILGLNPGGSPIAQTADTIGRHLTAWQSGSACWSSYVDESWAEAEPGKYGMQPRIRHMFDRLGIDLREVPASNVVFVRSNDEAALELEKRDLLAQCWAMHEAIIDALRITTVLCLGATAGRWVRSLVGANSIAGRFVESNGRRWTSEAHVSANGMCVITLTHPGRADWRNPAADPTPLIRAMLDR